MFERKKNTFPIPFLKFGSKNRKTIKAFKNITSVLLLVFSVAFAAVADTLSNDTVIVYSFDIKEEIAPPVWRTTQEAMREAEQLPADIILIQMNTYGGLVDAADSIRTRILQSPLPVYVFIENNAASAGALIAIACDSIYMKPGATIGAATVVDQSGKPVADKYQSYMRKKMRATAEQNGRDPDIAEAMVDPDKVVPGISDSGKVVTFTTVEAIKYGFCEKEVSSVKEIFQYQGIENYRIVRYQPSAVDKMISWLINPMISSILIMLIIGGIYFELQTPGLGFPIIASLMAAILYFAPLYLEGLAANWEIALFIAGVVLIAVEIFVIPGFGVAGVLGISSVVSGLAFSLIGNIGFDFTGIDASAFVRSFGLVIIATVLSTVASVFLGAKFPKSAAFRHLILQEILKKEEKPEPGAQPQEPLTGKEGVAANFLRPSGKVIVDGDYYEAIAETGYIDKGETVKVVNQTPNRLTVRKTAS